MSRDDRRPWGPCVVHVEHKLADRGGGSAGTKTVAGPGLAERNLFARNEDVDRVSFSGQALATFSSAGEMAQVNGADQHMPVAQG